jgi:orotate phosphoribosyltransferase
MFTYAERFEGEQAAGLYPVTYRIPAVLRDHVRGRRVAIVNDVINAGSAVRGTFADLEAWGADIVAVGALLVLGGWTSQFVAEKNLALEALDSQPNPIWPPEDCPLCARGEPLVKPIE